MIEPDIYERPKYPQYPHRYEDRDELSALPEAVRGAVQEAVSEAVSQLDGVKGVVVQNLNVTVNIGLARGGGATNVIGSEGIVHTR